MKITNRFPKSKDKQMEQTIEHKWYKLQNPNKQNSNNSLNKSKIKQKPTKIPIKSTKSNTLKSKLTNSRKFTLNL